jgi:hypothetical protein
MDTLGAAGGGGTTLTLVEDAAVLFSAPEQVSVNMRLVVSGPISSLPLVALPPDHPPEAIQELVLDDDQVTVNDAPAGIVASLAAIEIVGGGAGGCVTATLAEA